MPLTALRPMPERTAPPAGLETRPKQVKAWLEALPLARSAEAARQLVAHLAGINRAKVDVGDRVAILESYGPVAKAVLDDLDGLYAKSALPLGARAREALALARDFSWQLAEGYKIAVLDNSKKLLGSRKQMPLLVLRAIEYLALVLRASYKSYSPVPSGVWNEMHHLYLYADKEQFALEVADPATKMSITDAYAESLLLALTDPYRLAQGEIDKVLGQLAGSRGLTGLAKQHPQTPTNAHFIVPCDTDKPPKPANSITEEIGGPNFRVLDANPLVDRLRTRKQALETGNVSATTSKALGPDGLMLLGKLITLWGDPPKRASRRNPMEARVAICVGVKSVSHYVMLEPPVTDTQAEMVSTLPLVPVADDEASKAHPVHTWDVVNLSAGGVKVRRLDSDLPPVHVGEALGIRFLGQARWTIGAVRWLTMFDEGGMEFGIQFLAPGAQPVWLQPTIAATPQAKPGLVLRSNKPSETQAVLTLPNTFEDLREFELNAQGEVAVVRATGLIEKTARFELFHVRPS